MRDHLYAVDGPETEVEEQRLPAVLAKDTATPLGVFSAGMTVHIVATDGLDHRLVALARVGETQLTACLPRSVLITGPHTPRITRCGCGRETYADRRGGRCIICSLTTRQEVR